MSCILFNYPIPYPFQNIKIHVAVDKQMDDHIRANGLCGQNNTAKDKDSVEMFCPALHKAGGSFSFYSELPCKSKKGDKLGVFPVTVKCIKPVALEKSFSSY